MRLVVLKKKLIGLGCLLYVVILAGVLVRPVSAWAIAPIRVNAGGGAYTDHLGHTWLADQNFNTGFTNSTLTAISGTTDDALYQTERWDWTTDPELAYNFTVPNGVYQVRLHFAEIYGLTSYPGGRVFDVGIEGDKALDDFDIYSQVGANAALVKEFATTVSDGQLSVNFTHGAANHPKISALEVIPVSTWPKHPEFGPGKRVNMLVAGDSYSAGNGGGAASYYFKSSDDPRPDALVRQRNATPPSLGCFRSHNTWGEQAFKKTQTQLHNTGAFVNAACSGDVTGNLLATAVNPPQLSGFDLLRRNSMDLIALTIGGNDLGFSNVVVNCFIVNNGNECEKALKAGESMIAIPQNSYSEIIQRTNNTLDKLATDWPNAKIVLVGYPLFWENRNTSLPCSICASGVVEPGKRLEAGLNSFSFQQVALIILRNQSSPGRYGYLAPHQIDNKGFFDGHGLQGSKQPAWVHSTSNPDFNEWFHPTTDGYTAMGQAFFQLGLVQQLFQ
jgi:lysophospholipase L1-like esterase